MTGIVLSDDNDNNDLSCPQTTLAPAASMTCTATHTFTQAELDANGSPTAGSGVLANTVTATSNEAPPATDNLEIPIVQTPALTLVKSASPPSYNQVGQVITYSYVVTNTGNVTVLGQITVTDDKVTVDVPADGVAGSGRVDHVHGVAYGDAGGPRRGSDREHGVGVERRGDVAAGHGDGGRDRGAAAVGREVVGDDEPVGAADGDLHVSGQERGQRDGDGDRAQRRQRQQRRELPADDAALRGRSMTCTATHTFTQAELDANGSPVADSDKLANTVTATSIRRRRRRTTT